jgi:putative peptide-modifying radical SAM enzyme
MQYHILTTERCNLSCSYCGGTRIIEGIPLDTEYSVSDLKRFIAMDPDPVIGFYGGEPLLAKDRIAEIMDAIPARAFTLQTNGTLLHLLDEEHLRRFHSILVSLDGPREVTDHSRGEGIYDAVMENLKLIRSRGFKGDLIARMAFSDRGDIYRDVMHLLTVEDGIFDHVHWQMDVFWSDLEARGDISSWIERYDAGIQGLISEFGRSFMTGKVLGMVPFIPVMGSILSGKPTTIRCGSGIDSFSIMTSGEIHACPIAPELLYSKVGAIISSTPGSIRGSRPVGSPCPECDIVGLCGGRCLYSNMTMSWGREWFDRVCLSTRRMIGGLRGLKDHALTMMENGVLSRDAFDYPEINNGCEIIP